MFCNIFPCSLAPVFVLGSQWYDILWPNVVSLLQVMPPHRPTGNPAVKEKGWSRTPAPPCSRSCAPPCPHGDRRPCPRDRCVDQPASGERCWDPACCFQAQWLSVILLHACYANLTPAAMLVLWCCVAEAQLQVEFQHWVYFCIACSAEKWWKCTVNHYSSTTFHNMCFNKTIQNKWVNYSLTLKRKKLLDLTLYCFTHSDSSTLTIQ